MKKVNFLLGILISPSIDKTLADLEDFYQYSVKNFISIAYQFPDIPFTIFISGPFLEWLQDHHSEFLTVLTEMVKRKQVEILGGGFFNPLLPLIPASDRLSQIEELTTLVRKLLGRRPRGLWLTKTIWDSSIISPLNGSGIEYTFLDEEDFSRIGLSDQEKAFPRITENQGKILTVFPINTQIASQVLKGDFSSFEQIIRIRHSYQNSFLSLFLTLDDTDNSLFFRNLERGLTAFLQKLRFHYLEVVCVTPALFFKENTKHLERSYFAATTYEELLSRFGLPIQSVACRQSWRQFLTDFEASNRLYSKMIYTHILIVSLRGDKYKKKSAGEELWKAQDIQAYLPTIPCQFDQMRKKAFVSLLHAESLLRNHAHFQPTLSTQDFDLDGVCEFFYQGKVFNFYVDSLGGQIFEWDYLEKPWNYIDANDYNKELRIKPQMFVDRFFYQSDSEHDAGHFFEQEYKAIDLNREQKKLRFVSVSHIQGQEGKQPLKLTKTYSFQERELLVEYELELLSGPIWEGVFTSETFLSHAKEDSSFFLCHGDVLESFGGKTVDTHTDLEMIWKWSPAATWTQAVWKPMVLSQARYQAHKIAPRWPCRLELGRCWQSSIHLVLGVKNSDKGSFNESLNL